MIPGPASFFATIPMVTKIPAPIVLLIPYPIRSQRESSLFKTEDSSDCSLKVLRSGFLNKFSIL
jgi:hypothetical protein